MNILILSAGTRNKVVQYFKNTAKEGDRVIATDCSNLAPAVYDADAFYLVPRISDPNYIDIILDICKKEQIGGVFSLIDPELSLLAKERDRFLQIGVTPIVSPYELTEICFNKFKMYEFLNKKGILTGKCYTSKESFFEAKSKGDIEYPAFVKPICGSASININKVTSDEEIEVLFNLYDDLMVQEYMNGQEYGVDLYVDLISGKCTSLFMKKKIKMRAGETDKSVSVIIPQLADMLSSFAEDAGFRGMIDIDIFEVNGEFYLSEVNPRFGGGYPHAYECGVNMPASVWNNLKGVPNEDTKGNYKTGICMMKYNELKIMELSEDQII